MDSELVEAYRIVMLEIAISLTEYREMPATLREGLIIVKEETQRLEKGNSDNRMPSLFDGPGN